MKLFSLVSVATLVLAYLGAVTEAVSKTKFTNSHVVRIKGLIDQNHCSFENPASPTDTKVRKVVQLPCNNRPDRCDMPVDWFLWLGTHNSGAVHLRDIDEDVTDPVRELEFECGYNCQDQILRCIHLADINHFLLTHGSPAHTDLCGWKDKNVYLCHAMHGGQSLGLVDGYGVLYSEFLREAFRFLTTNPHQAIVLHLSDNAVNNNAYRVNLMQVDDIVDSVCKEFVPNAPKGACPLIHIQPPAPQAWPTLKQLVSLDDKNAKIKSRAIITNSGDFHAPDGYQTKCFGRIRGSRTNRPRQLNPI
ncbi:hypothetical protein BC936DRAFT_140019 [Jimgerdemannia flammicorona]|uniref:PLC-like phosphodiesterase n=1 Tax=Jimgerdemannia flammicorona TaxID=994334 RepID=A0A433DHD1_9FUNG|nr:hypothetical protein BC936DRAFT_140019 [Jimgerdemannia flammicorona]